MQIQPLEYTRAVIFYIGKIIAQFPNTIAYIVQHTNILSRFVEEFGNAIPSTVFIQRLANSPPNIIGRSMIHIGARENELPPKQVAKILTLRFIPVPQNVAQLSHFLGRLTITAAIHRRIRLNPSGNIFLVLLRKQLKHRK